MTVVMAEKYGCVIWQTPLNATMFVNALAASATCDATTETCTCSEATVRGQNALPDWMYDEDIKARHSNPECKFVFGRFNTNSCDGKRVLGYAMQVEWIVTCLWLEQLCE